MVKTFFPTNPIDPYILNFYRSYSFGKDKNLITTDHGAWVLLNDEEFRALRSGRIKDNPELFVALKEKGIIVTPDNVENIVRTYRRRYRFLFKGPILHILTPTLRCNMNCIYCHSLPKHPQEKGWDMDEDTARAIVDFILTSPADFLTIEFQGGEMLLNFDIVKFVIEYAEKKAREKNKKIGFNIVTNITLMSEEILEFFKKHHIVGISTSFDGPKEVHDKNRKYLSGRGTYDDVVYWIKRINDEFGRYFSLSAMSTITRYSLPYYKEIVDEFYELGFRRIWPRFLNILGNADAHWKKIGYPADEYLKFYKNMLDYIMKMNKAGKRMIEVYSYSLSNKILSEYPMNNVDMWSPCGAGIGQLLYNHNGDIFTCDEAKILGDEFKLGNVRENTIEEVIKHPTVISMMNISSKFPLICDNCPFSPYCFVCPVHFYKTQGNIVPKLAGEFRCKIQKEMIKTVFQKILFSKDERKIFLDWMKFPAIPREKVLKYKDFI